MCFSACTKYNGKRKRRLFSKPRQSLKLGMSNPAGRCAWGKYPNAVAWKVSSGNICAYEQEESTAIERLRGVN